MIHRRPTLQSAAAIAIYFKAGGNDDLKMIRQQKEWKI